MPKNYMSDVAKVLNLTLGEEFEASGFTHFVFRLSEKGLEIRHINSNEWDTTSIITRFLTGEWRVIKLPHHPREGEKYWRPYLWEENLNGKEKGTFEVTFKVWDGGLLDHMFLRLEMCYRTKEEAKANLAKDYERLMGKSYETIL